MPKKISALFTFISDKIVSTQPPSTVEVKLEQIFELCIEKLQSYGADHDNAHAVAQTIHDAERDGQASHGLFRLPGYVAALKNGKVNGKADPKIEEISTVLLRCNGQNGFAPLALQRAIEPLTRITNQSGLAVLALTHSHHYAALWHETEALASNGLVAFSCVSYKPAVAPAGGTRPLFGTNPIAFSWPRANDQLPMTFDMATASRSQGDIQIAARDGHTLPEGVGIDAQGLPSTDPAEVLKGAILPFGGYKGSAIALMVELLAGPLVGETISYQTAKRDPSPEGPPQGGQFLLALSPKRISGGDPYPESEKLFALLQDMPGARLPGHNRLKMRHHASPMRHINQELWHQVQHL